MRVGGVRQLALTFLIASWVAGCGSAVTTPGNSQLATFDETGILLVGVGEPVQGRPPTEAVAQLSSDAMVLAEANGEDLGYPWIDPLTGELVLSAVTPRGRDLIEAANLAVPHLIRGVEHGAAELRRIQDEATLLRAEGVPDAELIYAVTPDHRDNRTLIVIFEMSRPLLNALAERFPVDAVAVRVNPDGTG